MIHKKRPGNGPSPLIGQSFPYNKILSLFYLRLAPVSVPPHFPIGLFTGQSGLSPDRTLWICPAA